MSNDYNEQVAIHYSKYRPPLHGLILSKALVQNKRFEKGLDFGCGTGKSSKPLSEFCREVIGIDPSETMIENAQEIPTVTYIRGDEHSLAQFRNRSFDIVTFAGSLFYAKNEVLRYELRRICRDDGLIVIYDFEVLAEDLLSNFGLSLSRVDSTGYLHAVNISDWKEFEEEIVCKERVHLAPSAIELAHFILAHSTWHEELALRFDDPDPFTKLVSYLSSKAPQFRLPVNIFYSRYRAK